MKSGYLLLILFLVSGSAMGQNFSEDFSGAAVDDFAAFSPDWEAVWEGDGWTTSVNTGSVSPKTDVDGPGSLGQPADAFENAIVAGDASWSDYSVEASFRAEDDDSLGIVFRYSSPGSFYLLVMSRNTIPTVAGVENLTVPKTRLYRIAAEQVALLSEADTAYADNPSADQTVRVMVEGTRIRAWIAGQGPVDIAASPTIDVTDDSTAALKAGRAGLYAFAMGGGIPGTYFTSFAIQWVDSDGDGLDNNTEIAAGTDPFDADSDDDGRTDNEPLWNTDSDNDGLINALDWDSDNDGLPDGLELGIVEPHQDTDVTKGHFIADEDYTTTTSPILADSDNGGKIDGEEDANHNGKYDYVLNETDPNYDRDDFMYDNGEGDAGQDASGVDTDTGTSSDSEGPGTDTESEYEGGSDSDTLVDGGEYGSLAGGPSCSCRTVGNARRTPLSGSLISALLKTALLLLPF